MAIVCMSLSSCSKDDNSNEKTESDKTLNQLYGTWEYTIQRHDFMGGEETSYRRFTFNPDMTFSHIWILWGGWGEMGEDYSESDDYKGTFKINEDNKTITISYPYMGSTFSESYTILEINDNILTLDGDDKTLTYKRKK